MKTIVLVSILLISGLMSRTAFAADPKPKADPKEFQVGDTITMAHDALSPLKGHRVVAVLGSSRLGEGTPTYDLTSRIAAAFVGQGYAVVTGGGPGVMDAANRAAKKAGAPSIGFDTVSFWPRGQLTYLDTLFVFSDLQLRKWALMKAADVFLIMPGGLGTIDEVFTILGAQYSEQLEKKPIILVDRRFWQPLLAFLKTTMVEGYKTADQKHVDLLRLADTPGEALSLAKTPTK